MTWTAALAAALVAVVMGGGAAGARGASPAGAVAGREPVLALGASATTPTQSSVVFAMGHLRQPSNTFWELFLRPAGSSSWVLRTPPGVASNGGLVVAAPPAGSLTVGFLASADLKFSPVAQRPAGATTWSPGELPSPLATTPDALAVSPQGQVLALVSGGEQRVLSTSGKLSAWNAETSAASLSGDAPTCRMQGVTAVAFTTAGRPLLGLACARTGTIGILTSVPASGAQRPAWHAIGPSIDPGDGAASVLRLVATASGDEGLAQLHSGQRTSLEAFWSQGATSQWSRSSPLAVPAGWKVEATATGGDFGQGMAVLLGSGDRRRVEDVVGPGSDWVTQVNSPQGASAVSLIGTELDTFVVTGSHVAVWALTQGSSSWRRAASISVPVPYGSSS